MKTNLMPTNDESIVPVNKTPDLSGVDKPLYYVRRPYINFTKESNPRFKEKKITHIPASIFKVWICRYITLEKNSNNPEWFTFAIENNEIVAGFIWEDEAQKFEKMLDEIQKEGIPIRHHWTHDHLGEI